MKILVLCTGNSCRSQMAHGFLQSFDQNIDISPSKKNVDFWLEAPKKTCAVKLKPEVGVMLREHYNAIQRVLLYTANSIGASLTRNLMLVTSCIFLCQVKDIIKSDTN